MVPDRGMLYSRRTPYHDAYKTNLLEMQFEARFYVFRYCHPSLKCFTRRKLTDLYHRVSQRSVLFMRKLLHFGEGLLFRSTYMDAETC